MNLVGAGPALLFHSDGTLKERMLFGIPDSQPYFELIQWAEAAKVGPFTREFHRLQVEHWVWRRVKDHIAAHGGACSVLDIGVYHRRDWLGPHYRTAGLADDASDVDVALDLCAPDAAFGLERVDVVVCTEVLEHTGNPFTAMQTLADLVKPGGLLVASTPFVWPDHHTDDYPDYWRFTRQGWQQLLRIPRDCWQDIEIYDCLWTRYGRMAYDLMLQTEGMVEHDGSPTGFLVQATRC